MNNTVKSILVIGIIGGGTYLFVKHILPKLKKQQEPETKPEEKPPEEKPVIQPTQPTQEIIKLKKNYIYKVIKSNVNIREAPSRQSKVLRTAPKDKLFIVVEVSAKDNEGYHWGKVQSFGEERREVETTRQTIFDIAMGKPPEIVKETIIQTRLIGQPLGWIREDLLQVVTEAKNLRR